MTILSLQLHLLVRHLSTRIGATQRGVWQTASLSDFLCTLLSLLPAERRGTQYRDCTSIAFPLRCGRLGWLDDGRRHVVGFMGKGRALPTNVAVCFVGITRYAERLDCFYLGRRSSVLAMDILGIAHACRAVSGSHWRLLST